MSKLLLLLIALESTNGSIFEGLLSAQLTAKQYFETRLTNSTKLDIVFESPKDQTFESLDFLIKHKIIVIFDGIVDGIIDEFIQVSQRSLDALDQFQRLVNQVIDKSGSQDADNNKNDVGGGGDDDDDVGESSEPIDHKMQESFGRPDFRIKERKENFEESDDSYYIRKRMANRIIQLSDNSGHKWSHLVHTYRSIEQTLNPNNIVLRIEQKFFESLKIEEILEIVDQFGDRYHPLIETLFETIEYKTKIIESLEKYMNISDANEHFNQDLYFTEQDFKTICCKLLELLNKKSLNINANDIKVFIDRIPERFRNKFEMIFKTGGLPALKTVATSMCLTSSSNTMALIMFELTRHIFPIYDGSDYQKEERLFIFIGWIEFITRNAIQYNKNLNLIKESVRQSMEKLKEVNAKALTRIESLVSIEPFEHRFQTLFDGIEYELQNNSQ